MSPATRRYLVTLERVTSFTAEIDAPTARAARAIVAYLLDSGLWERRFFQDTETFKVGTVQDRGERGLS